MIPVAYFDTNVVLKYMWSHYFGKDKKKFPECVLIDRAINGDYNLVLSTFSFFEIYEHFRDYYLLNKSIQDGCSFREFHRARKYHIVSIKEEDQIFELLDDFENKNGINVYSIEVTSLF